MGRIQDGQSSGSTNHAADKAAMDRRAAHGGRQTQAKVTARNADGSGVFGENRIGGIIKELGLGNKLGKGSKAVKSAYSKNIHSLAPVGNQKQFSGKTPGAKANDKPGPVLDPRRKSFYSKSLPSAFKTITDFTGSLGEDGMMAAHDSLNHLDRDAGDYIHDIGAGLNPFNFNEGDYLVKLEGKKDQKDIDPMGAGNRLVGDAFNIAGGTEAVGMTHGFSDAIDQIGRGLFNKVARRSPKVPAAIGAKSDPFENINDLFHMGPANAEEAGNLAHNGNVHNAAPHSHTPAPSMRPTGNTAAGGVPTHEVVPDEAYGLGQTLGLKIPEGPPVTFGKDFINNKLAMMDKQEAIKMASLRLRQVEDEINKQGGVLRISPLNAERVRLLNFLNYGRA